MMQFRRSAIVAAVALLALGRTASAQQPGCTPPRAPERVRATVEEAIPARADTPFTPAVLTLTWNAPGGSGVGNPIAAYVVEAGSATGLADIGTTRTAGPELTFTTPMADGTYFVRVRAGNDCGISAPSPEIRVRISKSVAAGRPNPLVLLNTVQATRERLGSNAFVRVMGQVRNGWSAAPAALVTVRASYEGARGELGVMQTTIVNGTTGRLRRSGLLTDTVLEPGGTGCFVLFARFQQPNVTGLGLFAVPSGVDADPLPGQLQIDGPLSVAPDDFEELVVSGRVRNAGDTPTVRNEVWVEPRDTAGRVLDCRAVPVEGDAPGSPLPPGQTRPFRNGTEAPFKMSAMLRWWPTWDVAEAGAPRATPAYRARLQALVDLLADASAAAPQDVATARDALRREAESIERVAAAPLAGVSPPAAP